MCYCRDEMEFEDLRVHTHTILLIILYNDGFSLKLIALFFTRSHFWYFSDIDSFQWHSETMNDVIKIRKCNLDHYHTLLFSCSTHALTLSLADSYIYGAGFYTQAIWAWVYNRLSAHMILSHLLKMFYPPLGHVLNLCVVVVVGECVHILFISSETAINNTSIIIIFLFPFQEYIKITVRNPRTHISREKALYTDYEVRVEVRFP